MKDEHKHQWEVDWHSPVMDSLPPIYTYVCPCGAVGQSTWSDDGRIVVVREAKPESLPHA